jgi:hypothetical protein
LSASGRRCSDPRIMISPGLALQLRSQRLRSSNWTLCRISRHPRTRLRQQPSRRRAVRVGGVANRLIGLRSRACSLTQTPAGWRLPAAHDLRISPPSGSDERLRRSRGSARAARSPDDRSERRSSYWNRALADVGDTNRTSTNYAAAGTGESMPSAEEREHRRWNVGPSGRADSEIKPPIAVEVKEGKNRAECLTATATASPKPSFLFGVPGTPGSFFSMTIGFAAGPAPVPRQILTAPPGRPNACSEGFANWGRSAVPTIGMPGRKPDEHFAVDARLMMGPRFA